MQIDIWSDVVCPFCYLGKERLDQALASWPHADEVKVKWHSFELDSTTGAELSESLVEHIAAKYGTSLAQAEASQASIADQFAQYGLTFNWRDAKPGNTFTAHRILHLAADKGLGTATMTRLMNGYFAEGAPIGDPATVGRLAIEAGLDAKDVEAVLTSDAYAKEVRADEAAAQQIGISGVPFFVFDGKLGVSGAQPVEVFAEALNQAWTSREQRANEDSAVPQGSA